MKFNTAYRGPGWLGSVLYGFLPPGQAEAAPGWRIGQLTRRGLAVVLSAVMILFPMGQGSAFAQSAPPPMEGGAGGADQTGPPPTDTDQQAPQPLSPDQLDQLVAPIALYPDSLVAQVLAASTYPTQVVEADRWLKAQGNASPQQIAAGANSQNWDDSVKALTAFPQVLAQMDRNLQWTTDLGNAYYNQPQDVMDSIQAMRQRAQNAGNLRSSPQQTVEESGGDIEIAPANPEVVYVPVYDPWTVWGGPFVAFPGYYWYAPPGIFFGGLAIGFGIGIGIGLWGGWGWGWGHWGCGWHDHYVFFNHGRYFTRSRTVFNRGLGRPGGPPRGFRGRGAYARSGGGFNHGRGAGFSHGGRAGFNRGGTSHGGFNRSNGVNRGAVGAGHSGGNFGRSSSGGRSFGSSGRSFGSSGRSFGSSGRSFGGGGRSFGGGGRSFGGGGRSFGGGHSGGGGHGGGGGHRR